MFAAACSLLGRSLFVTGCWGLGSAIRFRTALKISWVSFALVRIDSSKKLSMTSMYFFPTSLGFRLDLPQLRLRWCSWDLYWCRCVKSSLTSGWSICIDSCGTKNFVALKTKSKRPKNGGFPIGIISFSRGRFFRGYVSFREGTQPAKMREMRSRLSWKFRAAILTDWFHWFGLGFHLSSNQNLGHLLWIGELPSFIGIVISHYVRIPMNHQAVKWNAIFSASMTEVYRIWNMQWRSLALLLDQRRRPMQNMGEWWRCIMIQWFIHFLFWTGLWRELI